MKLAQGPQQQQPAPGDLTSLYLQLAQRQQANETFNRGAGLLAASMYPGRRPDLIMGAMTGATQDPNAIMRTMMGIQQFSQQQQQYQAIQAAAPGLAQQLGVPIETARAIIASGKYGDVETAFAGINDPNRLQYMQERARALQGAGGPVGAPAAQGAPTPSPLTTSAPIGPAAPGGVGQGPQSAGPPAPGPVTAPPLAPPQSGLANPATAAGAAPNAATDDYLTWLAKKNAQLASIGEIAKERTAAKLALPGNDEQLNKIDSAIESIKTDPNLAHVLGQALPTTGLASTVVGRSPEDQALAQRIDTLNKQVFSEGFKTGGGARKTQQELNSLQGALGQGIQATYLQPQQYIQILSRLQDQTRTARANGYGEAGDFSTMPKNLNGYVDPAYRRGGMTEVANAPQYNPMSDAQKAKVAAALAAAPHDREQILSTLRANNFDPRAF
jgi:hypothetical protein